MDAKATDRPRVIARQLIVGALLICSVLLASVVVSSLLLRDTVTATSTVLSSHQPVHEAVEHLTRQMGWRLFINDLADLSVPSGEVLSRFAARGKAAMESFKQIEALRQGCATCHAPPDDQQVSAWYARLSGFPALLAEQESYLRKSLEGTSTDRWSILQGFSPVISRGIVLTEGLDAPMHRHLELLQRDALLKVTRNRYLLAGLGAFTLFAFVVFVFYIDRALRRPVNALMEGTRQLAAGDLSHRVPVIYDDEFGNLAERFNTMATRLEQEDAELRHEKEELRLAHQELESAYGQLQANAIEVEESHQQLEAAYGQLQAQTVELEISNQRLEQANKVKSAFVSMVSHELRTPLSVIRGYLNLILDDDFGKPSAELRQILGVADKRSRQLQYLIEEILDLTQIEIGELKINRKEADLRAVIEDVREVYQDEMERKKISCVVDIPNDFPTLWIDQRKMGQVFSNLLDNAIKFSPQHSDIQISARVEGNDVVCVCRDRGVGIDPDDLEHVFEPFYQADPSDTRSFGGMGLGLTIVREVIRGHGGTVMVDSSPGEGTVFTIRFPMTGEVHATVPTEVAPPDRRAPAFPAGTHGPIRILVVEDDRDMVVMLSEFFCERGISVTAVGTPLDALAAAIQDDYDMVLMDVMLPTLSGFDLTRIFKVMSKTSRWPLIIMSAAAQKFHVEEGMEAGAAAYVAKPFEFNDLYQKVLEVYDQSRR